MDPRMKPPMTCESECALSKILDIATKPEITTAITMSQTGFIAVKKATPQMPPTKLPIPAVWALIFHLRLMKTIRITEITAPTASRTNSIGNWSVRHRKSTQKT